MGRPPALWTDDIKRVVERGRLRSGYVGACLGRRPKVDVPQTDVMMMNHYLSDPHNVIYKNLDI